MLHRRRPPTALFVNRERHQFARAELNLIYYTRCYIANASIILGGRADCLITYHTAVVAQKMSGHGATLALSEECAAHGNVAAMEKIHVMKEFPRNSS